MSSHFDDPDIRELASDVTELQSQKKVTDAEITNIKIRLESYIATTQEQFRTLGATINEIRDMARDNKHITIGVDGNNGLKGTLASLVKDVHSMTRDFEFLRQTANSYVEMKTWLIRLLITSVTALVFQFAGAAWSLNLQAAKQDAFKEDLNKALSFINKQQDDYAKSKASLK
jgi:formamidopyrimidine-DNA glycosylase